MLDQFWNSVTLSNNLLNMYAHTYKTNYVIFCFIKYQQAVIVLLMEYLYKNIAAMTKPKEVIVW